MAADFGNVVITIDTRLTSSNAKTYASKHDNKSSRERPEAQSLLSTQNHGKQRSYATAVHIYAFCLFSSP